MTASTSSGVGVAVAAEAEVAGIATRAIRARAVAWRREERAKDMMFLVFFGYLILFKKTLRQAALGKVKRVG